MKNIKSSTIKNNILVNTLLLFPTIAFLCLLTSPSIIMIPIIIFALVGVFFFGDFITSAKHNKFVRLSALPSTMIVMLICLQSFQNTWSSNQYIDKLANLIGIPANLFIIGIGSILCLVASYIMYTICCWGFTLIVNFLKKLSFTQDKPDFLKNFKQNWYFSISIMVFFALHIKPTLGFILGYYIIFVSSLVFSAYIPPIITFIKNNSITNIILLVLTTFGISLSVADTIYIYWKSENSIQRIISFFPSNIDIIMIICLIGSAISMLFIYFCVSMFWKELIKIFNKTKPFNNIKTIEVIIYFVLIAVFISIITFSFSATEVFYGTEYDYDIIYTSDLPLKKNVYTNIIHLENDLRQPLFAVFSAPFVGIPYLFGKIFSLFFPTKTTIAIFLNIIQVIILFIANFLLTKILNLNATKRICFMILTSFTYTSLLSILMMEQYIFAYFWLIFCLYIVSTKQLSHTIALYGAGGTLLTSLALTPLFCKNTPIKNFKNWISEIFGYGMSYIVLMLLFLKTDIIVYVKESIASLNSFTGVTITTLDKINQYTSFIKNCFIAPNANIDTTTHDYPSWQLTPATSINLIGIAILLICIISVIVNRKNKTSLIIGGWVAYSIVLLFILGWGTKENGLILYSLYFCWAFFALLFQLVEKIESKLKVNFIIPALTLCGVLALTIINTPAISEMIKFGISYYPV